MIDAATPPTPSAWRRLFPALSSAVDRAAPHCPRRSQFIAFVRDPLFAFLVAGAAIFAIYFVIQAMRADPVLYTPQIEAGLVDEFEAVAGRKASAADRTKLRDDYITSELLFREAIARDMHLTDGETRTRLTDKVRYLIAGAPPEPKEEEIVNYYASNTARYQAEPKSTFSQVFFANQPSDSAAILTQLNAGEPVAGDDFWLGRNFPDYGDSMVRGMFGSDALKALTTAADGQWYGPIKSNRGWHFFRREQRVGKMMMPYTAVREQVRQDLMMNATREVIDREVVKLKDKYDVVIVD